MNLSTLYKKTSTGATQEWTIAVINLDEKRPFTPIQGPGGIIVTRFGQVGGKIQETRDLVTEGKNVGKANETAPFEQACLEAKAKWEKQLKKGYMTSIEGAQAGEVDEIIEGGINVMLAHSFAKHGHKITYPAYISRKLDGLRVIAIVKDGICTLWSRTRKPIDSLPHIVAELERMFPEGEVTLDGEAYQHSLNQDFEKLASLVRQEQADKDCLLVEYHVFDVVSDEGFSARYNWLDSNIRDSLIVKRVENILVNNDDEVTEKFIQFMGEGYEGGMVRSFNGPYEHKRSYHLQKVKEMQDAEFVIVGSEEGRGKLQGHVGAFVCLTEDGQQFKAKMSGKIERLKEFYDHPELWQGKQLTVQFQNLTGYGVPRFPVGLRIREAE